MSLRYRELFLCRHAGPEQPIERWPGKYVTTGDSGFWGELKLWYWLTLIEKGLVGLQKCSVQFKQATLPSETVSPVSVTVSQICSPGLHSAALRGCKLFNKSVAPGKLLTVQ